MSKSWGSCLLVGVLLLFVLLAIASFSHQYQFVENFRGRWGRRGWGRRGWRPRFYPRYYYPRQPWWWAVWPWGYQSTYYYY